MLVRPCYGEGFYGRTVFFHAPKAAFDADPEAAALLAGLERLIERKVHGDSSDSDDEDYGKDHHYSFFACEDRVHRAVYKERFPDWCFTKNNEEQRALEKRALEKSAIWLSAGVNKCTLPAGVVIVRVIVRETNQQD